MKDVEIMVFKPVFTEKGLRRIKCKVKYFIEEELAEDFLKEALKNTNHYVDRDQFKLHVLNELLRGSLKEGVEKLVALHKFALENKSFIIKIYLESMLDEES
jgi:hypothetical protein